MSAPKASDLAARMRGAATRPPAASAPPVTAAVAPPVAGRPVRFTLDLDRDAHRALKRYAVEHDARAADVLRVLLGLLDTDPASPLPWRNASTPYRSNACQ